ncbi:MAG: hypothetical protein HZB39_19360 [Planctomycetes bacterium]|nr:hypothetical protein [Planctomycetota bacterium]
MHRILFVLPVLAAALAAQEPSSGVAAPRVPRAPMILPLDYSTPQPAAKSGFLAAPGPSSTSAAARRDRSESHRVIDAPALDRRAWRDPSAVHVDRGAADGALWAGGADWKARFDARGFDVHPFLGSDAPTNYPVRFELQRVTVGGEELTVVAATPVVTADVVQWDRGGVVESVALASKSLEQSWRFDGLPSRDALRLDVAWHGALQAEVEDQGVRFGNEHGGLRYLHAIAIDALGRRLALPIEVAADTLAITVPASFVAEAVFPLVVDPVISVYVIDTVTDVEGSPDLAWDETSQQWLVTWWRQFSATDMDIWAVRLDAAMNVVEPAFTVDYTSDYWHLPSVASHDYSNQYLVVAQVSLDGTAAEPTWIGGRIVHAGTFAGSGAQFDIERDGVVGLRGRNFAPDVGGDSYQGVAYYTVVWTHETSATNRDVHMKQVDDFGNLRSSLPTVVDGSPGNEWAASISKSNGDRGSLQRWAIAYLRTWSPTDEDVRGALVTWDGQLIAVGGGFNFPIDYSGYSDAWPIPSSPTQRDGTGYRYFMIGCTRTPVTGQSSLGWVNVAVIDDAGGLRALADLRTLENITHGMPLHGGSVDSDGCRFALGYGEGDPFSVGFDARVCTLGFDAASNTIVPQDSRAWPGQSTVHDEYAPSVCARHSGGGPVAPYYGLAFSIASLNLPTTYGIAVCDYRGHAPLIGPVTRRVRDCGGLGISIAGSVSLCERIDFTLADSGPLTGFLIGPPVDIPFTGCGLCRIGAIMTTVPNPYSLTVPGNLSFVGLTLSIQGYSFNRGPCLGTIALSNIIDFTVR